MTAYNRVNGPYCSEHAELIAILRDEWGFDGLVMSDWFGTHSTAPAANAGLDLEMPGPPQFFGEKLAAAVRAGEVPESVLDDKAHRVLTLIERTGRLDDERRARGVHRRPDRPRDHPRAAAARASCCCRTSARRCRSRRR